MATDTSQQQATGVPRHFPQLVDPRTYAEYERRVFSAPTWDTFDNQVQFMTLRAFSRDKDGTLVRWREDLDLYTETLQLGRWMWLIFGTVLAPNFWELVAEMKKRDLFLFDVWGHVPGSEINNGMVGHVTPPAGMVDRLKNELGDRFLGFDNGEQDGRFLWGYANQQCPIPRRRIDVYQNFCHHFDRMTNELGGNMTLLCSMTFPHYLAKDSSNMLLGAESAQGLPCSQVIYSFVRGAGKQYGLLWFGNASVFNRWSYKTYEDSGVSGSSGSNGMQFGPTKGTSLSLLKRMMYVHIHYNCTAVGLENCWLVGDNTEKRINGVPVKMESDPSLAVLSPIGSVQAEAVKFTRKYGEAGVMHAPVALLLDFAAGWTVPRHLYAERIYEVWGSHPYQEGDYLTHLIFSMLYPRYEDASFYRDESGFMCETPFGDMTDTLLSDVSPHILAQYSLVVVANTLQPSEELKDKLRDYVNSGGRLVLTQQNAAWSWPELAQSDEITELQFGAGTVIVAPSTSGVVRAANAPTAYPNECEQPLNCPYELDSRLKDLLEAEFTAQQIFSVGEGLGFVTNRRSENEYRVIIYNNHFVEKPFKIEALNGVITDCVELELNRSERLDIGYQPETIALESLGGNSETSIAGGDIRIFDITLAQENLRLVELAPAAPASSNLLLRLRSTSLDEAYRAFLARPTFFDNYTGIVLGWRCLLNIDAQILDDYRVIFNRKGLEVVVDFSESLNYYPDLVLIDTLSAPYEETMRKMNVVFKNCGSLGVKDIIFSLHRKPEERCDEERAALLFRAALKKLSIVATEYNLTLHLQTHPEKWLTNYADAGEFLAKESLENIQTAYNLCHALFLRENVAEADLSESKFVLLSLPSEDAFGQMIDAHAPLHSNSNFPSLSTSALMGKSLILDAIYETVDEEYKDVRLLKNSV